MSVSRAHIVVFLAAAATTAALFGAAHLWAAKRATSASGPPVPLLWKVSDADNSLYLLGSFHLLKREDYPLSADVDAAFRDAEAVVFELSPDELASPELSQAMARAGTLPAGETLDARVPPATARALTRWLDANDAALSAMGLDAQAFRRFEPWYAGLLISLTEMSALGLDPALGLDQHFSERAVASGKPTAGLERAAEQIALFDGMSAVEQVQFLDEALAAADEGGGDTLKMHADWRNGDADALWREMAAEFRRDYPDLYRRINVARNDAWLPKLEDRLKRGGADDILVVVGSLHLLGDDGVVEKLRAKGYEVVRLCGACPAPARSGRD